MEIPAPPSHARQPFTSSFIDILSYRHTRCLMFSRYVIYLLFLFLFFVAFCLIVTHTVAARACGRCVTRVRNMCEGGRGGEEREEEDEERGKERGISVSVSIGKWWREGNGREDNERNLKELEERKKNVKKTKKGKKEEEK